MRAKKGEEEAVRDKGEKRGAEVKEERRKEKTGGWWMNDGGKSRV